jgi:predicted metalloprotease with PDZ domain
VTHLSLLTEIDRVPIEICHLEVGAAATHEYLIVRGQQKIALKIRSVPVADLLALAAKPRGLMSVRLGGASGTGIQNFYLSGLSVTRTRVGMVVSRVLPGTPAYEAGIEEGTAIVAVTDAETDRPSSMVEGGEYRAKLRLTLVQHGSVFTKDLVLRSTTEVLQNLLVSSKPKSLSAQLITTTH